MNLSRIIAELQAERDRLNTAIASLERLSQTYAKRRGRPPSWRKQLSEFIRQTGETRARNKSEPRAKAKAAYN